MSTKCVDLIYKKEKIASFPITSKSTLKELKALISKKFGIKEDLINLSFNNSKVDKNDSLLSEIMKNSKSNAFHLEEIVKKFKIFQIENEDNAFTFDFDMIKTSIDSFKNSIFAFFKEKMDEINYKITKCEFYYNINEEKLFFTNTNSFASHFINSNSFCFLFKDSQINFYYQDTQPEIEKEACEVTEQKVEIRKNVESGQKFKVLVQTYNHLIKEIEVYPEMTIGELKEQIEIAFLVRKEYQELLYLVYRLNDDNKSIKDYYIRPKGIIFLRGFYFPLIFADFYEKTKKNVLSINIAEQIKFIKEEIITRLKLDKEFQYKLIFNGKELNDNNYLIDYNVQKMQMIYLK